MSISQVKSALKQRHMWNMYDISDNNPEHLLFDSVVVEMCDIRGVEINLYIPLASWDKVFGEDTNKNLVGPISTKMVYEVGNEDSIIDSFGINSDETLQFAYIPMTTYTRDCSGAYMSNPSLSGEFIQPAPGTVIHIPWNDLKYEIVDAKNADQVFMAKKFVWSLILRPFRYSHQSLEHYQIHTLNPTATFTSDVSAADGNLIYDDLLLFGDNEVIEDESNTIHSYSNIDEQMFGR